MIPRLSDAGSGVEIRVVGPLKAKAMVWYLSWATRLLRLPDDVAARRLKWALGKLAVERRIVEDGPWLRIATGWDYVREAR